MELGCLLPVRTRKGSFRKWLNIERELIYLLSTTLFSEVPPNHSCMKNYLRHVNCIYFNRLTLSRLIGFLHYWQLLSFYTEIVFLKIACAKLQYADRSLSANSKMHYIPLICGEWVLGSVDAWCVITLCMKTGTYFWPTPAVLDQMTRNIWPWLARICCCLKVYPTNFHANSWVWCRLSHSASVPKCIKK